MNIRYRILGNLNIIVRLNLLRIYLIFFSLYFIYRLKHSHFNMMSIFQSHRVRRKLCNKTQIRLAALSLDLNGYSLVNYNLYYFIKQYLLFYSPRKLFLDRELKRTLIMMYHNSIVKCVGFGYRGIKGRIATIHNRSEGIFLRNSFVASSEAKGRLM